MTITLLGAWEMYKKNVLSSKLSKTILTDASNWKKHVGPYLGDMPLDVIRNHQIAEMRECLEGKNLSPQSVKHCLALSKRILRRAVEWELYPGPVPVFRMPTFDNRRLRFLSPLEAQKLLQELKNSSILWHDLSIFSLYTGLRKGEIFKLTPAELDLQSATVYVIGGYSKNRKHRAVPLNLEALKIARRYVENNCGGVLFQNHQEGQPKMDSKIFSRAVKKCGLNNESGDRVHRVVFHTLRHTFASWLVQRGTPLIEVCHLLGHSNITMTMRYAHLAPDHSREAINGLILPFISNIQSQSAEIGGYGHI